MSGKDVLKALSSFGFQIVTIRGSHAKLRRTLQSGERQTLTIPLHQNLAPGTLRAIFRKACKYVSEADLRQWFFTEKA